MWALAFGLQRYVPKCINLFASKERLDKGGFGGLYEGSFLYWTLISGKHDQQLWWRFGIANTVAAIGLGAFDFAGFGID